MQLMRVHLKAKADTPDSLIERSVDKVRVTLHRGSHCIKVLSPGLNRVESPYNTRVLHSVPLKATSTAQLLKSTSHRLSWQLHTNCHSSQHTHNCMTAAVAMQHQHGTAQRDQSQVITPTHHVIQHILLLSELTKTPATYINKHNSIQPTAWNISCCLPGLLLLLRPLAAGQQQHVAPSTQQNKHCLKTHHLLPALASSRTYTTCCPQHPQNIHCLKAH